MKPIKTQFCTHFLPAKQLNPTTKKVEEFSYHFFRDAHGRFTVHCIEVTEEDITKIKENGGRFWMTFPGPNIVPFNFQHVDPFTPKEPESPILGLDGKPMVNGKPTMKINNDENPKDQGPSDNQ